MSGVDAPKADKKPAGPVLERRPVVDVAQHLVRLAASCMATMDIRYYLNGIFIEPREAGGVFIVGCDGHRLMAVIDETGSASEETIISMDKATVSRLVRPAASGGAHTGKNLPMDKVGNRLQTEQFRGKTAMVLTGHLGQVTHVRPDVLVEGKFPDWRRVIPDFGKLTPGAKSAFNHRYLNAVVDAFAGDKRFAGVVPRPYQVDQQSAIVWHLPRHENALLIIMPLREEPTPALDGLFTKNWNPNARRPRQTAKAKAEEPMAVPAGGGASAQGGQAAAGGERAAGGEAEAGKQAPPPSS